MSDYTTTTTIASSPAAVFDAILDTRGWWNASIDGSTTAVGDEFGFEVEGLALTRIRIIEIVPNERVEWTVTENHFTFITDQSEWVGDRIVFELHPTEDGTTLTFTQHGLTEGLECYDVCSNAWAFFIHTSLRELAEGGIGRPESSAGNAAPAARARSAAEALQSSPKSQG